jgi:hypothetical protein
VDFLTGLITVRQTKSGYARQIPMNSLVRSAMVDLGSQRSSPDDPEEPVFRFGGNRAVAPPVALDGSADRRECGREPGHGGAQLGPARLGAAGAGGAGDAEREAVVGLRGAALAMTGVGF